MVILDATEVVLELEGVEEPDEGLTTVQVQGYVVDAGPRGGKRKRCVAPQGGGGGRRGGGGGGGGASQGPIDLEAGEQGEGGHSEGELDRMVQEQLARIRGSWSHASAWHCSR